MATELGPFDRQPFIQTDQLGEAPQRGKHSVLQGVRRAAVLPLVGAQQMVEKANMVALQAHITLDNSLAYLQRRKDVMGKRTRSLEFRAFRDEKNAPFLPRFERSQQISSIEANSTDEEIGMQNGTNHMLVSRALDPGHYIDAKTGEVKLNPLDEVLSQAFDENEVSLSDVQQSAINVIEGLATDPSVAKITQRENDVRVVCFPGITEYARTHPYARRHPRASNTMYANRE